jgi:hypothetical protein
VVGDAGTKEIGWAKPTLTPKAERLAVTANIRIFMFVLNIIGICSFHQSAYLYKNILLIKRGGYSRLILLSEKMGPGLHRVLHQNSASC